MSWYCDITNHAQWHRPFHDNEHGYPVEDDNILFERLMLEINQAGLSWLIILKKRDGFRRAFDNFDVRKVANYGEGDIVRLLNDSAIIRNKLKINAAIYNANVILKMQQTDGGFINWLKAHHPQEKAEWVKLFKKTFRFTGGEITNEFLMGCGFLPHAHRPDCPIYKKIAGLSPPWMQSGKWPV